MRPTKRWIVETPDPHAAAALAAQLKVSPLVAQILINRGVAAFDSAKTFMQPTLMGLADPALLPGQPAASQRIARALRDREKIVIYGDYDVDGITAAAILWHALRILGGDTDSEQISSYIPHRIDEGYGLNSEALTQIIDAGAKLIITVDCGITAAESADLARRRGVDLIITDHHDWHLDAVGNPQLPDCFAIVHPRLPAADCGESSGYPNPFLCGAGVAFKLAWGIGQAMAGGTPGGPPVRVSLAFREFLIEATALAALGTIADVVPLVGENRVLAHFGLGGLKESKLTGILALIASAGLAGQKLDSYHVGFLLGPRLNACGRLGHARLAVEMLTTATQDRANEIAAYLEEQNRSRQTVEKQILQQALEQIESNGWADGKHRALVLGAEGWHAGVIGIVASRIVEKFCRPTLMIALNNGRGQGSGRSIAGFHLAHALEACGQHLLAYGGHEMAAGLKIDTKNLDPFRHAFCDFARQTVSDQMLMPQLRLECEAEISQITQPLVKDLQRLGPFGHGNRRPLLWIKNATIAGPPRKVGKTGDHLQLQIKQDKNTIRCIAFGQADMIDQIPTGTMVDLAVEPTLNEFSGRVNVELEVKDIRVGTA